MSVQIRPMADAAVLLRPLRTRILGMLAEPQSAAGIARRLDVARQKVGYHLKELEKQGWSLPLYHDLIVGDAQKVRF